MTYSADTLLKNTVAELVAVAKEHKIKLPKKAKKEFIIQLILAEQFRQEEGKMPKCSNCDNQVEGISDSLCPACKAKIRTGGDYVTCVVCEKLALKSDCLKSDEGWFHDNDENCEKTIKDKAIQASNKVKDALKDKKAKKTATGERKQKSGSWDNRPLYTRDYRSHQNSMRYSVWTYISLNPGVTTVELVKALDIELASVRDCVKKMYGEDKVWVTGIPSNNFISEEENPYHVEAPDVNPAGEPNPAPKKEPESLDDETKLKDA